jgi:hypothetical protein
MVPATFNAVNEHCLNSIRSVTARHAVVASEDICDEHGRKLWAKGQLVSADLHERLLARKLRAPLELSLDVQSGADAKSLAKRAAELMEQDLALAALAGKQARRACGEISRAPVEKALKLLLTCAQENGSNSYDHAVKVVLLSAVMALRAELPERDTAMTIAGAIAHDVGELYVNPEYLNSKRPLSLAEWRHVVVHPLIGRKVVGELTTLPKEVAEVVAHHHERENGTGYPLQSFGGTKSRAARIVALAESLSGILNAKDNTLARSNLALKLMGGEFTNQVLHLMLPQTSTKDVHPPQGFDVTKALDFARGVSVTVEHALTLINTVNESKPELRAVVERTQQSLHKLEASLHSSGLITFISQEDAHHERDAAIYLELEMIPREIAWRLRNLARGLSLAAVLHPGASRALHELAEVLSG